MPRRLGLERTAAATPSGTHLRTLPFTGHLCIQKCVDARLQVPAISCTALTTNGSTATCHRLSLQVFSYGTAKQIAAQKAWLEADLAAVDRAKTPWLVVVGHKAYWEKDTDWSQYFDSLFAKYQVDLFLTGHTHNYQRTRPVVNEAASDAACLSQGDTVYTGCTGTPIIVAGSPGCSQDIGTKLAPKGEYQLHVGASRLMRCSYQIGTPSPPSIGVPSSRIAGVLLTSQLAYGYGYLTVNKTHLKWNWFETAAKDAASGEFVPIARGSGVTDDAMFVKA